MSSSIGEPQRIGNARFALGIGVIVATIALFSWTDQLAADCPPAGLSATFTDIQVAGSSEITPPLNPSIGISSYDNNAIMVVYEGLDPNSQYEERQVMVARYHANGTLYSGDPFPLTAHNSDESLDENHYESREEPSLAISGDGSVAVSFISKISSSYYLSGCTGEIPCPLYTCQPNCNYARPDCNFGICHYGIDTPMMMNRQFQFSSPPGPEVQPILPGDHRNN